MRERLSITAKLISDESELPWATNLHNSKKYQSPFSVVGKVLVFWWSSVIFCKFWPRFCINNFNIFQNRKHEKRLETDVPSLESSVFMRIFVAAFTFGDRCSTNWAIPLNKKSCVVSLAHLQGIWYHRHAVLSSVFQHKNTDLGKNLCYRVWYARYAHFILSKIACD